MKILICFITLAILVLNSSCNINTNKESAKQGDVVYEGIVSWELDLQNKSNAAKITIDEKLAGEIGDAVMKAHLGDKISNMILHVSELKGRDIYVVTRLPKDLINGGDYNVAIDKKDGAILKFWIGE